MPVAVPGAAVSPGARSCNLANPAELTVIEALVLLVTLAWVVSEAVKVHVPAVLFVTLKFLAPLTRAALAGRPALASVEAMATRSFVFTKFQKASTELTVTLKAVAAV